MHFVVTVLISDETEQSQLSVEDAVSELMEQYGSEYLTDAEEEECGCIGNAAVRQAEAALALQGYNYSDLRNEFLAIPREERPLWAEFTDYQAKLNELTNQSPLSREPDEDCWECQGTGVVTSQYNPDTEWDWYVIGGRWNGVITGKPRSGENGFNFAEEFQTIEENMIHSTELVNLDFCSYAILLPTGVWVTRETVVWDYEEIGDEKQWEDQFKALLRSHPHTWAVAVDCHI